jgi:hypothetical protein
MWRVQWKEGGDHVRDAASRFMQVFVSFVILQQSDLVILYRCGKLTHPLSCTSSPNFNCIHDDHISSSSFMSSSTILATIILWQQHVQKGSRV